MTTTTTPALVPVQALLDQIAVARQRTVGQREEASIRCPVCNDTGWREIDPTGRGVVERCRGALSSGCPAIAFKTDRARKAGAEKRGHEVTTTAGEGAQL